MPGMGPFLGNDGGEGAPQAPQAPQAPSGLPPELLAILAATAGLPGQLGLNEQARQMALALRERGGATPQAMQHGWAALPGAVAEGLNMATSQRDIRKQQAQLAEILRQYTTTLGEIGGIPPGGTGASPM